MEISGEIFEQHLRNISEKAGGAGEGVLVERRSAAVGEEVSAEVEGGAEVKVKIEEGEGEGEGAGAGAARGKVGMDIFQRPPSGYGEAGAGAGAGGEGGSLLGGPENAADDPCRYKFRFPHLIPMVRIMKLASDAHRHHAVLELCTFFLLYHHAIILVSFLSNFELIVFMQLEPPKEIPLPPPVLYPPMEEEHPKLKLTLKIKRYNSLCLLFYCCYSSLTP
jgi:hypothetical protein